MQTRRRSPGRVFGRGLALAGMVLGAAGLWSMHAQETKLPVYFLVAPYEVDVRAGFLPPDSFVVPMTKPEHVNKARELLGLYPQPIVMTLVAPGADGINRNYGVPGFPGWSWHVTEFTGFGDLIIWEYNTTPFLLEEYGLDYYWLSPYVGYVGYGVARELGPVPLVLSVEERGDQLQFYWSGVGTNAVYRLESAVTLASTNWVPVVTGLPEAKTNRWSLPRPAGPARFYRAAADVPTR